MNPQHLIRSAVATLAAATFLVAQSAPMPSAGPSGPASAAAPKASAASTERLQVRLAEVIAMLEEDDLTAEQRAQAKKKLEEISARLRAGATPKATEAPRAIAVVPDSTAGPLPPKAARAPRLPDAAEAPDSTAGPLPPKAARAPRPPVAVAVPDMVAVVADEDAQRRDRARERAASQVAAVRDLREAAEKARAAAKADEGASVRYRIAEDEGAKARTRFAEVVEQNPSERGEWRVAPGVEAKRKMEVEATRDGQKLYRSLVLPTEGRKVDVALADEPKVLRLMGGQELQKEVAEKAHAAARKAYTVQLDEMKKAQNDGEKAKLFAVRTRASEAADDDGDGDDDDRKILKLLAQMRAEMREIKAMLQELKQQQAQPTRTRVRSLGGGGMKARAVSPFGSGGGKTSSGNVLFGAGAGQSGNGDIYYVEAPAKGQEGVRYYLGAPAQSGAGSAKAKAGAFGVRKAKKDDDDDDNDGEVKAIEVRAPVQLQFAPAQSGAWRSARAVAPARAGGGENQMR